MFVPFERFCLFHAFLADSEFLSAFSTNNARLHLFLNIFVFFFSDMCAFVNIFYILSFWNVSTFDIYFIPLIDVITRLREAMSESMQRNSLSIYAP